ncbi:putative methyltransferase-domain-containing protein [Radiomyces spectabilis]|uniref:putative methyltransferase-domain-containing protein n=1 Tax=Radiomyces spectabilis TaxID=64574 RepID=UPI00221F5B6E|nr:putative methyltransferase-domain-containing protein [Radiomyces spectabilis]KAI8393719.1 putative methyltransferase-domain-containing protein [Radiomyces spectabilis]
MKEEKAIATIEGWEDGKPYIRDTSKLDRWELQSAERLTIHIGDEDVVLVQDPHSNHLGGYIWLTSIVFCKYLYALSHKRDRHNFIQLDRNKRWVELGSGVGLIGIMLHKLGLENVTITDIAELLPTMERNVEANNYAVHTITGRRENTAKQDNQSIIVEPLLWNDAEAISHIKSMGDIDYIVACDCIYSEASAIDLVETMDHLATSQTYIICISEVRNQAAQDAFLAEAKKRFTVDLIPAIQWQKKVTDISFDETLNLYRLRKPKRATK